MKKVIVLVLVVLSAACTNHDDNNGLAINSQNLLGKWYIKGGTYDNGPFENYNHDCATNKDFQEFFDNGELTFNGFNSACELTEVEPSLWVLNGNILTVSNTNFDPIIYEYVYTIEKLTSEELIVKQTVIEPEGTFVVKTTFTRD
jgi:hypothetical protein